MTPEEEKSIIQPLRDLQKELRLKEIEDLISFILYIENNNK